MIQIVDMMNENLLGVSSICMKHPKRGESYSKSDIKRINEAWRKKYKFLIKKLKQGARAKIAYKSGKTVGFIEFYPRGLDKITFWASEGWYHPPYSPRRIGVA